MRTETLYMIRRPVAHRIIEAADIEDQRRQHRAGFLDVPTPADPADWCCDICSTPLDVDEPVYAVGLSFPSYALCAQHTASVLTDNPDLPIAPCPCAGCHP